VSGGPQIGAASPLAFEAPVRRRISKGERHSYQLTLASHQFVRVLIDQTGMLLGAAIYGPRGQTIVDVDCSEAEPTPISLIVEASGVYRLEIRSLESESITGSYEAAIETLRAATESDKRRVAAERLFVEGEKLAALQQADSNRTAIERYEEARSHWRAIGAKREEARAMIAIGEIYHPLGEARKALDYYTRALSLSQEAKDLRLECETLSHIGLVHIDLGGTQVALDFCNKALKLSQDVKNRHGEAHALDTLGEVYYAYGEKAKALEYYQQALSLWRCLNHRRGMAKTLTYSGLTYSDLGDTSKALDAYNEALPISRSTNDRRGQVAILTAIGHAYSRLGKKQEALAAYDQAGTLNQQIGDPLVEARILNGIAFVYEELGEKDKTLEYYTRSMRIYETAGYLRGQVALMVAMGQIYFSKGEYETALESFQKALPLTRKLKAQSLESYALKNLGSIFETLGDKKKALEFYNQAVVLHRSLEDRRGEAYALSAIGNIFEGWGEKEKALDYQTKALQLNLAVVDRFKEVSTLFRIARIERDLGRLAEARAHVEDATSKIESLRADVAGRELRESFIADVRQNYELSIDVLMLLHRRKPSQQLDAIALHTSERARARSLLEMLTEARVDIRQGVDSALLERERALQRSLTDKGERYSLLLTRKHSQEQAAAAAKEIEEIRTEYQQVQAQIRSTSPRYAALTQPQPLSLKEIQEQVLDPDTLLLEYALGDERSYLWAVTSDSLTSFELPKRPDIEAAARRVYDLLTAQNQIVKGETELQKERRVARADADYSRASGALSQMVLGPVASQLGAKRLLIVADGALQYIPFGALPVPSAKGIASRTLASGSQGSAQPADPDFQPLIVEHEIVSLPSASTLGVMRRELANRKPAPKAVAVLADPVFSRFDPRVNASRAAASRQSDADSMPRDFKRAIKEVRVSRKRSGVARLPFSRAEAAAIKAAAPPGEALEAVDFDASRATATSEQLSQYRIIHFATHGLLNSAHPELSGMIFSLVDRQGKLQNGFLRLHEVYNLNLPAELVVLSACQTGLGKDVKGEGIVGLTRGFMYAGAARVVASLWQVDDSATAELMKRFYAKMLGHGLRPAAALRDAQVEMWRQKLRQSPYYWAGFVLQGEWK